MTKYWQIASGSESRDFSDDFLQFGMAFVGGTEKVKTIRQVRPGDRIVLKRGLYQIVAAGVAIERDGVVTGNAREENGKDWLLDYDGWELPGYCFVEWHKPDSPVKVKGLTRPTIQLVNNATIQQATDEIIATYAALKHGPEPPKVIELSDDEMLEHMIKLGLSPITAETLTMTLRRIRLLAKYYYGTIWDDVREHETRTFLITPLLLALGWSEQQIKIELGVTGGRIDIACFSSPYGRDPDTRRANDEDCVLILESKGFSQGLDYAHEQGKAYAKHFPNCQIVVSSNGYCYKAYRRRADKQGFETAPAAYLNLLLPKNRYMRDPERVDGGLKVLEYLLPQTWMRGRG
jgi:hypothetical protein